MPTDDRTVAVIGVFRGQWWSLGVVAKIFSSFLKASWSPKLQPNENSRKTATFE
jgi:hypothetical protein